MTYVMFLLSVLAVFVLPNITVLRKHDNSALLSPPSADRNLSQTEIDELVDFLLSKRNGSAFKRQSAAISKYSLKH